MTTVMKSADKVCTTNLSGAGGGRPRGAGISPLPVKKFDPPTTRLIASPDLHAVVLPVKRAIALLQQSG